MAWWAQLVAQVGAQELAFLVGLAAVGYGVALVSIPGAWVTVGAILVCLAWPRRPRPTAPDRRTRSRGD